MKNPKYLIQKFPEQNIGVIHLWTLALSKRGDMQAYDGVPPVSMRVELVDAQPVAVKPVLMKTSGEFSGRESYATFPPETPSLPGQPASAVPAKTTPDDQASAGSPSVETDVADAVPVAEAPVKDAQDMTPVLTPEEKHMRLVHIIGKWPAGDPEYFTTTGLPRLDSLIADLGADVETRERDAAWTAFNTFKPKK